MMSTSQETPFQISIPDDALSALKTRLSLTRFPDELDEAGWDYGAPLKDIQRLVAYWKDGYDWRKHEREMNEGLRMFTRDVEVEGHGVLNVHYVHERSGVDGALPLFFSHGWPGSFAEVQKLLPLLTAASPDHPSFHVVAFSLPGYGFSEAPHKPGFAGKQYAEVAHKLMLALGYNEYVVQGGDWGNLITRTMAKNYGPEHVKGWHTNMPLALEPSLFSQPLTWLSHKLSTYTPQEKAHLARGEFITRTGRGYFEIQATKPQTIGYSMADSPVGLLAWIYEKLVVWTDEYEWSDDEVLTWVSIYWFSRAGPAAAARIYYETRQSGERNNPPMGIVVPIGVAYFPKELRVPPRSWIRSVGNVVFESEHDRGGHFAAHENPEGLADDLRKMFGRGGPAYGVVPGKTGYA
ncbi:alpha/beta-hydrolase [Stereum hirsutum FP-91666 SS1]|uniref:alpha/beta-hydrolase n=1 Tax=Stereum hirsutum (strain FP-91666) TaxID=721885 RepID=UPI000444A848|nr:alpha/beta-hydrolase [Stereum hirsutum FP-91666 SS1]EIM85821.1 alpha/beta-hydrolase [Stereum hirsutum FP-91666 SS1]